MTASAASASADSKRIYLFDTTLRDGAQTQGVDFSVQDKRMISDALDTLGIDYIEGGWPGANPTDTEFFAVDPGFKHAKFVAFGMTRGKGRSAANDPVVAPILNAPTVGACFVGKSWTYQVDVALKVSYDENLAMIGDTIAAAAAAGKEAMYDAEHFFDGYKADRDYALACASAAFDNGARWVVLCDTNGGTLPHEVEAIINDVLTHIPGNRLGVHFHDDTGHAVANSLTAVRCGARQVQGTLNGLGERCGNANLTSLIPSLKLKTDFEIGVDEEGLQSLTKISRLVDEILGRAPNRHAPYVGANAFAHKGGLHASAVAKDPRTYEHIPPESVGNERQVLVSNQAGRSNVLAQLTAMGLEVDPKDPRISDLTASIKTLEAEKGLTFDGADASFELYTRQQFGQSTSFFQLDRFRVIDERRHNAKGDEVTESMAMVQLEIADRVFIEAAPGNGPVDALNAALRKALLEVYPGLKDMHLTDYRVRILDGRSGTAAKTRVMIESEDSAGRTWTTVGVSTNIIDASFDALLDAIAWKLLKEGVHAI
ncbi:MAG: citramalate synthase [Geminicoccus sp.]|nr:citramalate synthase [Geminicoccus sp.]